MAVELKISFFFPIAIFVSEMNLVIKFKFSSITLIFLMSRF